MPRGIRDSPESPLAHAFYGGVLLAQGRYAEASTSYRAALARVPTHVEARVGLATALLELGDLDAAEREAELLSAPDTEGPFISAGQEYILARIDLKRGNTKTAIERLRRATSLYARFWGIGPSYEQGLADAYLADGQTAEAARQLETALAAEPYRKTLHYELGLVLEAAGESERAAAEYRRFLEAWREADADAPFLAEARARLAALRSTGS